MEPIRLMVVDDGPVLVEALAHILPRRGSVRVQGPVWAVQEAGETFERGLADLALIDLDRMGPVGLAWIGQVRDASERARVLAMTDDDATDVLVAALGAGACGFVPPRLPTEELLRALARAAAGELVIPVRDLHRVVGRLHRNGHDITEEDRVAALTVRETEILRALSDGWSTPMIAARCSISVMTVQSHVKNILAKLGVHSKVEAVTLAWRAGTIEGSRSA